MQIVAEGLKFPEGPVAMPDGSVILVEIAGQRLSRVYPDGRVEVIAEIPGGPNGAALGPDGRIYVCNNGGFNWKEENGYLRSAGTPGGWKNGSIEVVDLETGTVERLYDSCDGISLCGPNDIVFDEAGGFYFTDLGKKHDRHEDRGFVYYATIDGTQIKEVVSRAITPNGIGLSPDGKTLYVSETDTARLWAWDILGPGELSYRPWPSPCGGTCVAGLGGYARFDSLAVTASGNICVATLDICGVTEISPDGRTRQIPMPDLFTTNICFGGMDMRTAWVTLSHGGRLLKIQWDEPGLKLNFQI